MPNQFRLGNYAGGSRGFGIEIPLSFLDTIANSAGFHFAVHE